MKILIYKRTHKGDPDENGVFGNHDCMGRVRNWNFDAVIGIGGKTTWKGDEGIKHKINWVGIEPKKIKLDGMRGDCVVFSHFELFEEKGQSIKDNFPGLFEYMYDSRKRFDMSSELPSKVLKEVEEILELVRNSPQSPQYGGENLRCLENKESSYSAKCKGCFNGKELEITVEVNETC